MKVLPVLTLSLTACAAFHDRPDLPRPPVCVRGTVEAFSANVMDYGSAYVEHVTGPMSATPDTYLVPAGDAGPNCIPPPWWQPE